MAILIVICLTVVINSFRSFRSLQPSFISKSRCVLVAVLVAASDAVPQASILREQLLFGTLPVSRQRRENKRKRATALKLSAPICCVTFASMSLASASHVAKPKVSGVEMCPPVGSHLAIAGMCNPLKGRELVIVNDDTVYHSARALFFCHWTLFGKHICLDFSF